MKLEKVTLKQKGWILEEIEDANKPTKVEPEKLEQIDLGDPEAVAKREEQIKKIIAKRLEGNKKVAEETKGEDHAILGKDIKVKEELCKNRKEVGALVEKLKKQGIKPFVKKVNEGENRYKVFYKPLTEKTLKENDCDNIDIEALEWYVKNYSEGDNITVTADLLNVLEQSLEMYKKHCGKGIKEEVNSKDKAVEYWANEVEFQIDEYYENHELEKLTSQEKLDMAYDIAYDIVYNSDNLWSYINETIWDMLDDATFVPSNESLNESEVKEEVCPKCGKHPCECEEHFKEDIEKQKQAAFENACDCLKYGYGRDKWNSCGLSKEDADEVWKKAFAEMSKEESKKPINKKISNPRKEIKEEKEHKGPFEIEYWVDEEARDMGFGDIYLERFDDLEEAKAVADDLFGEVASVEVLDANGEVVYGRYPEDEGCSKKTIKEDVEVARVEYCVMDELDNNIECFDNSEDAINFALENEGVRVLEVSYGPRDEYDDEEELGCEEIWSIREDLHEDDKKAPESIEDCQKWIDYDIKHYGKISDNTNEIIKKAGFQIIKDDHGDYEVTAGHYEDLEKKEKKFAKKVVQPGVQMDDDDMDTPIAFNEAEAHAMIGDKPIVEDQKSQIEMANDFSNTTMNNDALKSLEDDDNI